jgi:hypothetical protein
MARLHQPAFCPCTCQLVPTLPRPVQELTDRPLISQTARLPLESSQRMSLLPSPFEIAGLGGDFR